MVARFDVIQRVLGLFGNPRYLEIGVDSGETFGAVSAAQKVAVDPNFKFNPPPDTAEVRYVAATSDQYFATCEIGDIFDVVYIDGLHTFEQSFRDLTNSLSRLQRTGVLIVDDILPTSYHASLGSLETAFAVRDHLARSTQVSASDNTWMGTVYKLAFVLDAFFPQLSFATVLENHGQLIAWFEPRSPAKLSQRDFRDIALLDFVDTITHRATFNIQPLPSIIQSIIDAHHRAS